MFDSPWKSSLIAAVILAGSLPVFAQGTVTHLAPGQPPTSAPTRINTISVGEYPLGVATTPDATRAYVVNGGYFENTVSVIGTSLSDPATYDRVTSVSSPWFFLIKWIAMRDDGKRAYITQDCGYVLVLDTDPSSDTFHQVLKAILVGGNPNKLAVAGRVNDRTSEVYVAVEDGYVAVIDSQPGPTENTVTAYIQVDGKPHAVATASTPAGIFVYVTQKTFDSVSVIQASNHTVIGTIAVDGYPTGIATRPDSKKVYVTNLTSLTVSVIDTNSNTFTGSIDVGLYPQGVAFSPDGTAAYVANRGGDASGGFPPSVSVVDTSTELEVLEFEDVGELPDDIAFTADGTAAYVTNSIGFNFGMCLQ